MPGCKRGLYTQYDSIGENQLFSDEWLSIEDCFWVRDGGGGPLRLSALGSHQAQTCAGPVHAASLCEFMSASVVLCLEDLVSLMFSIPSGYYTHSAPSLEGFPEL